MEIAIRHAMVEDLESVLQGYAAWGYRGTITPRDVILMAERGNELVGLVRMVPEEGTLVLRGMYVRPSDRRSGIGRKLLSAATLWLGARECYCVPYEHLEDFYGQGGFQRCDVPTAPPFLQKRLEDYCDRGLNVLLLRRPETQTALRGHQR
jgi:GNAT superfamily N-acetyltransferase